MERRVVLLSSGLYFLFQCSLKSLNHAKPFYGLFLLFIFNIFSDNILKVSNLVVNLLELVSLTFNSL